MKYMLHVITALLLTFMVSGCAVDAELSPEQDALIQNQAEVYTQVSMWMEKNHVYGTNYSRGFLIPINSKVKLLKADSKEIVFEYNGQEVTYLVYTKYTHANTSQMLKRLFAKKPVNLSKYKHAKAIKHGNVLIGMTKDEVLLARGYPPFHETPSLKANNWKYWHHRFSTAIVVFKNDKVLGIRGII